MSREIKFRVWDKVGMRFHHTYDMHNGKGFGTLLFKLEPRMDSDDFVVEQYTGMKDKNGVDIYEGDIVCGKHDFGPGGFLERRAVVAFDVMRGYQWNYWDTDTLEVIGNIHENPELLEKE